MAADGRAEFDPKEIASAEFPTAFRGYDQEAVRQYLTRLAAAVGRAQQLGILGAIDDNDSAAHFRAAEAEREAAELRARVAELEALVEAGFDHDVGDGDGVDAFGAELDDASYGNASHGDVGEGDAGDGGAGAPTTIDEAELIEHLGQETAKILEAARSAAADITRRAEEESAVVQAEAADEARIIRDDAEQELAAARIEAARILTNAGDEAAQIQERLEAEANRAYDDARDEADRIVAEASAKVEADLSAARQRAAQIVGDAEGAREEVLGDLVRRRRVHRSQLTRLTDARDRLARALAAARSELDEVATTIDVANGDSSIDLTDPEPATQALDDDAVAELITRLDRARAEAGTGTAEVDHTALGHTAVDHTAVEHTAGRNGFVGDDDTVRLRAQAPSSAGGGSESPTATDGGVLVLDPHGDGSSGHRSVGDTRPDDAMPDGGPADEHAVDEVTVEDHPVDEHAVDRHPLDEHPYEDHAFDADSLDGGIEGDDAVAAPGDLDGPESIGGYEAQAAQAIDELNGPIDGDRLLDQLGFTDDRVLGTDDGSMGRLEARGDLPRNTPFAGSLPDFFEYRDIAMAKATPGFRRRLKRAVNDDQSDVLDRLRAGRKEIEVEELPPLDDQLTGYIAALTPALRDVVVAGAQVLGSDDVPLPAVDNLCLQLAKHIVDNLRLPTIDAIDATPGADREAILDPVRAIYRDFRNELLPDLIDDALHEAFALGVFHAIGPGEPVLWVVDPRLDPDPICEDNSASPPLVKGADFPSGHTRPLSMPGCRCLAVPAN